MNTKLHITHLEALNQHWFSLRFKGPSALFSALSKELGKHRHYDAYWDAVTKCWILAYSVLMHYAHYFDNLAHAMRQALKKQEVL